ncbi:hypothetical protein LTSEMIS_5188 [Salmonella enterica subsp. enterica serovar Mississippi str. A4-633]|nr:hypothetical protein LTSEMIS_5188 [Salmonella enterica subsp. enterica serovar Mississippi str. A4-633]
MPGAALAYPAWPIRRFPQDNRHRAPSGDYLHLIYRHRAIIFT